MTESNLFIVAQGWTMAKSLFIFGNCKRVSSMGWKDDEQIFETDCEHKLSTVELAKGSLLK